MFIRFYIIDSKIHPQWFLAIGMPKKKEIGLIHTNRDKIMRHWGVSIFFPTQIMNNHDTLGFPNISQRNSPTPPSERVARTDPACGSQASRDVEVPMPWDELKMGQVFQKHWDFIGINGFLHRNQWILLWINGFFKINGAVCPKIEDEFSAIVIDKRNGFKKWTDSHFCRSPFVGWFLI